MYLDLEDYRPDTPRVPQAISLREGVLASLLAHAILVIVYLVTPESKSSNASAVPPMERDPVTFVQMTPLVEKTAPPRPQHEFSDLDRRAATPQKPPDPKNAAPFSAGDTPEKVVGGREEKPAGPPNTGTAAPAASSATVDLASKITPTPPVATAPPAGGGLSSSLKNLSRYLQDQNYDNQQGGQAEQQADIQFDSKGIEFGPWLRRFVAQVKRNWFVPQAAMALQGKVVIQFYIHRDGRLTDINVVAPSAIESYTTSALNALRRSNPTLPLPDGYPDEKALFTVTFYYDVRLGL